MDRKEPLWIREERDEKSVGRGKRESTRIEHHRWVKVLANSDVK